MMHPLQNYTPPADIELGGQHAGNQPACPGSPWSTVKGFFSHYAFHVNTTRAQSSHVTSKSDASPASSNMAATFPPTPIATVAETVRDGRKVGKKPSTAIAIEDFPNGYPRFSALVAAHDSFLVTRRFSHVRTRLLLLEQDKVSELEAKLNKIDLEETRELWLGSRRRDKNENRLSVIAELKEALKSYDDLVFRTGHMLAHQPAHPKDVVSLHHWHNANACITRAEMGFLDREEDLMSLSSLSNTDILPAWVERGVTEKLLACLGMSRSKSSRDPSVHIYSRQSTNLLARAIITSFIMVLVVIPVVICYTVTKPGARLAIVITTIAIFILLLSLSTKGKMLELVVAGATYATVLIVFISGPGGGSGG